MTLPGRWGCAPLLKVLLWPQLSLTRYGQGQELFVSQNSCGPFRWSLLKWGGRDLPGRVGRIAGDSQTPCLNDAAQSGVGNTGHPCPRGCPTIAHNGNSWMGPKSLLPQSQAERGTEAYAFAAPTDSKEAPSRS